MKHGLTDLIERLNAYESLGYDPCELQDILKEYKELKQKSQSVKEILNSIYGTGAYNNECSFRKGKVYPYTRCVDNDLIKEILKDDKHSVNIFYSTDGIHVNILPFDINEEE